MKKNLLRNDIRFFCHLLNNVLKYGRDGYSKYVVNKDSKLVFLGIPKGANSSIKVAMFHLDCGDDQSVHKVMSQFTYNQYLNRDDKDLYCFSVVRNPFDRLVSCYYDKVQMLGTGKNNVLYHYLFGYLRGVSDFASFIRKVSALPDFIMNRHFAPQYYMLYYRSGKCKADFIGKYENLEEDLRPIMEKYNFAPLPHYNSSNKGKKRDWRDSYTLETAEIVHRKFKKDFEAFGYEDSYRELIEYLKQKDNNRNEQ